MPFWKWLHTASSNATADTTINWAEGMAPSAVNDSARAMMARLAEWRDDISGAITTGGASTAYTVLSNQGFDNFADMNRAMIAFVPHVTNGAAPTLNVDGLGALPLRLGPIGQVPDIQSGLLIQGTPYVVTCNQADAAFYLQGGFANPYGVPVGGMMVWIGGNPPNSAFVVPIGQAISRTTYATLFAVTGSLYGPGDGSSTFNLPDLRGRAVFGVDTSPPTHISAFGGNFDGSVQGNTGGAQNHTLTAAEMPAHSHGVTDPGHAHAAGNSGIVSNSTANVSALIASSNSWATSVNVTGISIQNSGGGAAHTILPPAIMLPYILRII
jgi:microcystin-dependent protein